MRKRRFTRWFACAAMLSSFAAQQVLAQTFTAGHIAGDSEVGILASEPLDLTTAQDAANYSVAGVTVQTAILDGPGPLGATPTNRVVVLILSGEPAVGATVTVSGVATLAGGTLSGSVASEQVTDTKSILGHDTATTDPGIDQFVNYLGAGSYLTRSGGSDIWGNADRGIFAQQTMNGSFFAKAQVSGISGPQDWSKTGIMARETLAEGSRNVLMTTTRPVPDSAGVSGGVNVAHIQWRDETDGGSGSTPGEERYTPVTNPMWVGLLRPTVGNDFIGIAHRGETPPADWWEWDFNYSHTIPGDALPDDLFVGLASTSHDNAATENAITLVESYTVEAFSFPPDPAVIVEQPSDVLAVVGDTVTFSVVADFPFWPARWLVNGVEVDPSQVGHTFTLATTAADKDAEVVVELTGGDTTTTTSDIATLTLDDPAADILVEGMWIVNEWADLGGTTPDDLYNAAAYPDSPTSTFVQSGAIDLPDTSVDNFGREGYFYFKPDVTDSYHFFLKSDDGSEVHVNPLAHPTGTYPDPTAQEPNAWRVDWDGGNPFYEPGADNATTSTPIPMIAGQYYPITVMYKEGGGGDYLQLAARALSDTTAAADLSPIPGSMIATLGNPSGRRLNFTEQPQDQTRGELQPTTFTVDAETVPEANAWGVAAWEIDVDSSGTFVEIPGSNVASYTDPGRGVGIHLIRAKIAWLGGESYSDAATYEVFGGTPVILEQPEMTAAAVGGTATFTVVTDSPFWPAQWFVNGAAVAGATEHTFVYTPVAGEVPEAVVTVVLGTTSTVESAPATMLVDPAAPAVLTQGLLTVKKWNGITGTQPFDNLYPIPEYPDSPDEVLYMAGGNFPATDPNEDDYGTLTQGYFKPDVTGDFSWMIRSDDSSELVVNPIGGTDVALPATPLLDETVLPEALEAYEWGCCADFQEPGAATQTSATPLAHMADMYYAFSYAQKEGGGGDWFQLTAREAADTTPAAEMNPFPPAVVYSMISPAGHRAEVSQDPEDATVDEGQLAVFTVEVAVLPTSDPYGIQWQEDGVDIPGANGTDLQFTAVRSDDGKQYRAQIFPMTGEELSTTAATLTVIADVTGPVIDGAGALAGSLEVGIDFDEPVDVNSATNPANYTVTGVSVTAAEIRNLADGSRTGEAIILTCSGTPADGAAISAPGVMDLYGNLSTTPGSIELGTWTSTLLGPATAGGGVYMGNDALHIAAAGNDIWNAADAGTYVYQSYTGAFEITGKMEIMDNAANDWSKIGLMVRETLDTGSRNVMTVITSEDGNNLMSMQWRETTDGGSASTPNGAVLNPDGSQVQRQTPAWWPSHHRLVRRDATANAFEVYYSQDDGVTWVKFGEYTMPGGILPETVFVGVVSTSHVSDSVADAFANVSELSIGEPTAVEAGTFIGISAAEGIVTITWEGEGELYSAPEVAGEYTGTGETDGDYESPATPGREFWQLRQ